MISPLYTALFLAALSIAQISAFTSFTPGASVFRGQRGATSLEPLAALGSSTSYLETLSVSVNSASETQKDEDETLTLLNEALISFNSSAATEIVSTLNDTRNKGVDPSVTQDYLDNLLSRGPDAKLPIWARFRPLARFSKRARLASLRRTLDLTTPPPNESDNEQEVDDAESQQRRRRRALVSLLRTLSSTPEEDVGDNVKGPAILYLEQKAKRAQSSTDNLRSRLPEGLETPKYDVVVKRPAGYEIRHYESFAVCSVAMNKPRPADAYETDATVSDPKMKGASAFGALAGYLFGKNQQEQAMAMTTPVLTTGQGDERQMSFVLPSEFWKSDGLSLAPKPLPSSGVQLQRNEGGDRAVVMFGGYASKNEVDRRKKQLMDGLAKDKEWKAVDSETIALSQYNDPFTPPWKRLNEVSIAVEPIQN